MSDTATAPEAPEFPVSRNTAKLIVEQLRERAEGEETTLAQVVELTELKRTLDGALKAVKDAIAPRNGQLLQEFAERGESSARDAASGKLAYVNRRIWARPAIDKADAAEAMLADPELSGFVEQGFNVQSVSAFFNEKAKEREADGHPITDDALADLIPEPLRDVLSLTADRTIGVRS